MTVAATPFCDGLGRRGFSLNHAGGGFVRMMPAAAQHGVQSDHDGNGDGNNGAHKFTRPSTLRSEFIIGKAILVGEGLPRQSPRMVNS